jgi:hypothetical protein
MVISDLRHPYIVDFFGIWIGPSSWPEAPYMIFSMMKNGSLEEYLANPLDNRERTLENWVSIIGF